LPGSATAGAVVVRMISVMLTWAVLLALCFLSTFTRAQVGTPPEAKSVTVPLIIDHGRILIDVDVLLSNGTKQHVRAWVDNGNPDLYISQRLATTVICNGQVCSGTPPVEMSIGGMTITLGGRIPGAGIKEAKVPAGGIAIAAGVDAEMNIPSTILRRYDVLIDFPGHQFTIAQPGTLHFRGPSSKVSINAENGLIQIPSQIENKKYNLALDVGASISFLAQELFERLASAHSGWPQMTGAVGPANMWGEDGEAVRKLMRIDRLQYGPLFLTNAAVAEFPKDRQDFFTQRAGIATQGLLGAQALQNYRVGLDYAHSVVYFEIGRTFNFPDFDVVGLILRPEPDRRFTVLGIADLDGKPSAPKGADGIQTGDHLVAVNDIPVTGSTMGQVWSLLGGTPGQERRLTLERYGKRFAVVAKVQHFLAESEGEQRDDKKHNK
jgi:hypothetical protein